jgi:7-alpha-hydroxysteroid dehydrogenase
MLMDRFRLDGKVAIVTGAGRGIGRAIALGLGEAGAGVVCAARTQSEIDATAASIERLGGKALARRCDVTIEAELDELVAETMRRLGAIDVVVNVAGGTLPLLACATSAEVFEGAFHFNVTSAFLLTQKAIPHMLERGGGAVVNISSAMSHLVESGFVAYGTAKAALNHMTRLLACEYAPLVRVNALAVGSVLTDALTPFLEGAGLKTQMEALTPMKRLGAPEDVALLALYLASPASSWMTGKVLEIDGGTVDSNWPIEIRPI